VTDHQTTLDIPELLVESGLVSSHDLSEAVQLSKRLQISVSRALLTSNCIDQSLLEMAFNLQLLVKEELLNREAAFMALRRLAAKEATADELLDEIYASPRFAHTTKTIAELLKLSGIVTAEQLEPVLEKSYKPGVSLRSALIGDGILSAGFFQVVVRIQERLRKGRLNIEQAVEQIKTEYGFWLKADESQKQRIFQTDAVIEQPAFTSSQSGEAVAPKHDPGRSFFPNSDEHLRPTLAQYLEASGFLRRTELDLAYRKLLSDADLSAYMFESLGLIKPEEKANALMCHKLVDKGHVRPDEAIKALRLSRAKKIDFKSALQDLSGWSAVQARQERRKGLIFGVLIGCFGCSVGFGLWLLGRKLSFLITRRLTQSVDEQEEIP